MSRAPSTQTRMPSSVRAVKVYVPAPKLNWPVQRTEKLLGPSPLPGQLDPNV